MAFQEPYDIGQNFVRALDDRNEARRHMQHWVAANAAAPSDQRYEYAQIASQDYNRAQQRFKAAKARVNQRYAQMEPAKAFWEHKIKGDIQ